MQPGFHTWVLGMASCVVLAIVNQFIGFKTNLLNISSVVAQIVTLPPTLNYANTTSIVPLNTQDSIKLPSSNYHKWRMQMNALLVGYDSIGFLFYGTTTCPSPCHADYNYWHCQNHYILNVIIFFVNQDVITMLGNVTTSKNTWDVLNKAFATKTRARIMYLK